MAAGTFRIGHVAYSKLNLTFASFVSLRIISGDFRCTYFNWQIAIEHFFKFSLHVPGDRSAVPLLDRPKAARRCILRRRMATAPWRSGFWRPAPRSTLATETAAASELFMAQWTSSTLGTCCFLSCHPKTEQ